MKQADISAHLAEFKRLASWDQRANIEKAIEPKLDAWYAANQPVQWA